MSLSPAIAFDTHHFVKQMVATGFTEEQAETQVRMLTEILGYQLSTKADVANLDTKVLEIKRDIANVDVKIETTKAELKRDIETVKAELQRDIKELDVKIEAAKAELKRDIEIVKADLQRDIANVDAKIEAAKADTIKWTAGMFAAQTALIIGAMFAVMRPNQPPPQVPVVQEMRMPAPTPQAPPPGQGLPAPAR
ncbi:MAG: DUF1640 domain-containing protein [Magnetococcales bacterium]|nr:DUF1640 domain-containing protein [Magnetococcales bacterium]